MNGTRHFAPARITPTILLAFLLSACGGSNDSGGGATNRPPVADAGVDLVAAEGAVVTLDASASKDPDGDTLTFAWQAPQGVTLSDAIAAKPVFSVPAVDAETTLEFTLEVDDGRGGRAADSVAVTVNRLPVVDAGADFATDEAQGFTLTATGSDPEGGELEFAWTLPEGFLAVATDSAELTVSATPDVTEDTGFTFTLTVTDANDASASDDVTVTLRELPELTATIGGIKKLGLAWEDIDGVDHYRLLENPDGVSGFQLFDDFNPDVTEDEPEIPVHLLDWANASYLVEACFDFDCTEKRTGDAVAIADLVTTEAIAYVKASDPENSDLFGNAVALSGDGNTLAVGAPSEDSVADDSGAIYVFARDANGDWAQQAKLKASNAGLSDVFASSVALSFDGNTLAAGGYTEGSSATGINGDQSDNSAPNSGAAYVFVRDDDGNWSQQAYVKAPNTGTDDQFGRSIALSNDGNTLAVGAWLEDGDATGVDGDPFNDNRSNSGAVYVYTRDGTDAWSFDTYIKASNAGVEDGFGFAMALSGDGNTLVVGAHLEDGSASGVNGTDNDNANSSGAAYVYAREPGGDWDHQAYIKASNSGAGDRFGFSVAISDDGDTLAVGATSEDGDGRSVNAAGNNNNRFNSGAAYVFLRSDDVWVQDAYVKASNADEQDDFGTSMALSADGHVFAVAADGEDSLAKGVSTDGSGEFDDSPFELEAGAAYVFVLDATGEWRRRSYVKAANTGQGDVFGKAIALAADGGTLAVGAFGEDGGSSGINGEDNDDRSGSGAVYLY